MPTSKRGFIGGLVTCFIPLGTMLGAVLGAYLAPLVGWRGLFAVGLLPALLTLLIRAWVPESPRWLARMGRAEEAREALGWALKIDPQTIPLSAVTQPASPPDPVPRSVSLSAQPIRLLDRQSRHSDRRLRRRPVGARLAHACHEGPTRGGLLLDDFCQRRQLCRPLHLRLAIGSDRTAPLGRDHRARSGGSDGRGRPLSKRFFGSC